MIHQQYKTPDKYYEYTQTADGVPFTVGHVYWMLQEGTTAVIVTEVSVIEIEDQHPNCFIGRIRTCQRLTVTHGYQCCYTTEASAMREAKKTQKRIILEKLQDYVPLIGSCTFRSLEID